MRISRHASGLGSLARGSRPHPPTARPGLLRWLIVVLALAGLGLLQSSHCDDMRVAAAMSAADHTAGPAAEAGAATPASPQHHDHEDGPAELAAMVDDCPSQVTRMATASATRRGC